ncbi:MAG: hypothetical protein Q4Q17_05575 [Tissierellia bacterium]|nr:hypothetical protein [Tissierellia bacterium]
MIEDVWLSTMKFDAFISEHLYEQVPGVLLIVIFVPLVIYGIEKHTIIMPHE